MSVTYFTYFLKAQYTKIYIIRSNSLDYFTASVNFTIKYECES